jgi:hypothetical protein
MDNNLSSSGYLKTIQRLQLQTHLRVSERLQQLDLEQLHHLFLA